MKQVLLYRINAERLVNILNGLKTIEIRKRDLPQWAKDKLARGEKVVGYGYCTKGKPYLFTSYATNEDGYTYIDGYELTNLLYEPGILNGRVVVKFEVSGSEKFDSRLGHPKLYIKARLQDEEVYKYGNGKDLYAHHIKNIQPVNMELGEFYKSNPFTSNVDVNHLEKYFTHWIALKSAQMLLDGERLTKAPQSFQTVWVKGE